MSVRGILKGLADSIIVIQEMTLSKGTTRDVVCLKCLFSMKGEWNKLDFHG